MPTVPTKGWIQQNGTHFFRPVLLMFCCIIGFVTTPPYTFISETQHDVRITMPDGTSIQISPVNAQTDRLTLESVAKQMSTPQSIPGTATPTPGSISQPAPVSPSGELMPVGDLPGWRQVFADDFTTDVPVGQFPGQVYGNKFTVYPDGTPDTAGQSGGSSGYYPSKVVSVSNGILNLYLHTENGVKMAAAILPVLPGNHLYGKYTIRFRSDAVQGFKVAWLLWPDSENWPQDGEIDFPEGNLSETIGAYMHHQNGTFGSDQDAYASQATFTSWHTTSIEWTPTQVKFILDGNVIGTSTSRIPSTPMHWVIQTKSCLVDCPSNATDGNVQIDWLTAYVSA